MKMFALAAAFMLIAAPALAGPVTLRANPVDDDGRVTLGDLFEGAGPASGVVVANRVGPSVVFEAGQLQSLAGQSGLQWANPRGLRRVVVRHAAVAPAETGAPAAEASAAPTVAVVRAPVRSAATERVIARNDMVEVSYSVGGISLSVTGRAMRAAAVGESVPVLNLQSGRTIDAVASGPGRAVAGPGARANSTQLAAR